MREVVCALEYLFMRKTASGLRCSCSEVFGRRLRGLNCCYETCLRFVASMILSPFLVDISDVFDGENGVAACYVMNLSGGGAWETDAVLGCCTGPWLALGCRKEFVSAGLIPWMPGVRSLDCAFLDRLQKDAAALAKVLEVLRAFAVC